MLNDLTRGARVHFREIKPRRCEEFVRTGGRKRDFFPHRLFYLPKCGPDGFQLAARMCGQSELDEIWEIVLFAHADLVRDLPADLFFDPELIWHQQHFGRPGQVATANLVLRDARLFSMVHISDLVQRISRRREHKTRIENRFRGWDQMLLNGILSFAVERGVQTVLTASADLAIRHTDRARSPARELFDRIYDRHVQGRYRVRRQGDWWSIDVPDNRDRIVLPERESEPTPGAKIICVCHDVERGFGHLDVDRHFARRANACSPAHLQDMLSIEQAAGVRATYSVVGVFLPEVRQRIERGGHAIAFHSYDHRDVGTGPPAWAFPECRRVGCDQLRHCRKVDYRIRGYRPPQSRLTPDLSDEHLCFHNFEWLASSATSLGLRHPVMERRLVKIPILFDDFAMHRDGLTYEAWEEQALAAIDSASFVAFSLHDCYAHHWLASYQRFLEAVQRRGVLKTLDEVANEVILRHAWKGPAPDHRLPAAREG